jgi:hypothetical protein
MPVLTVEYLRYPTNQSPRPLQSNFGRIPAPQIAPLSALEPHHQLAASASPDDFLIALLSTRRLQYRRMRPLAPRSHALVPVRTVASPCRGVTLHPADDLFCKAFIERMQPQPKASPCFSFVPGAGCTTRHYCQEDITCLYQKPPAQVLPHCTTQELVVRNSYMGPLQASSFFTFSSLTPSFLGVVKLAVVWTQDYSPRRRALVPQETRRAKLTPACATLLPSALPALPRLDSFDLATL